MFTTTLIPTKTNVSKTGTNVKANMPPNMEYKPYDAVGHADTYGLNPYVWTFGGIIHKYTQVIFNGRYHCRLVDDSYWKKDVIITDLETWKTYKLEYVRDYGSSANIDEEIDNEVVNGLREALVVEKKRFQKQRRKYFNEKKKQELEKEAKKRGLTVKETRAILAAENKKKKFAKKGANITERINESIATLKDLKELEDEISEFRRAIEENMSLSYPKAYKSTQNISNAIHNAKYKISLKKNSLRKALKKK